MSALRESSSIDFNKRMVTHTGKHILRGVRLVQPSSVNNRGHGKDTHIIVLALSPHVFIQPVFQVGREVHLTGMGGYKTA